MKTISTRHLITSTLAALTAGLLLSLGAQAQIVSIIVPASAAGITFGDSTSFFGSLPGSAYTATASPWTTALSGGSLTLPSTIDGNTSDTGGGSLKVLYSGMSYAIVLNNVVLNQALTSTGFADLQFQFVMSFQLGVAGLATGPTLYPNFLVTGTVQSPAGSFAAVAGSFDYYGTVAGSYGLQDTVSYNYLNTVLGTPFGPLPVIGAPTSGTLPALDPGTAFNIIGSIRFTVDPASINATTVPEPSSALLALLAAPLLLRRRRA